MRKIESLFFTVATIATIIATSGAIWRHAHPTHTQNDFAFPATEFGAFLAAQHAIYVNDFDSANNFATKIEKADFPIVKNTQRLAAFLSGHLPIDADQMKKDSTTAERLIYDAYLVTNNDWDALYKRHKKDDSALVAPLRVWSSVATGRVKDAMKFIDGLPANDAWKSFLRGQIYAETGDADAAAREFANVPADFMNINDYLYMMSFYQANNMFEDAEILRGDFTVRPGGMFMAGFNDIPDWALYSGYNNALAFCLIQNVSHTSALMYSDLSVLLLRFAQIIAPDFGGTGDATNYYLGQYFFNANGDFASLFEKIATTSPFYPFCAMRQAEASGDISELNKIIEQYPQFVPAVTGLVAHHVQNGNQRAALRTLDTALGDDNLGEVGRAFFLKNRAYVNYVFGDIDDAQTDIYDASVILPSDPEIMALQAKIWVAQNREIENAYDYAMMLIQQDPADIMAWDTLGRVVAAREGVDAALDMLVRVGEVSKTCSALFEQLGDLYSRKGDAKMAARAYSRAIELSDDGLTVVPNLKKKLRISK